MGNALHGEHHDAGRLRVCDGRRLRKNGINDESEYSALTHLRDSTPAGVKTKCEDVAAGYLALREGGKQ